MRTRDELLKEATKALAKTPHNWDSRLECPALAHSTYALACIQLAEAQRNTCSIDEVERIFDELIIHHSVYNDGFSYDVGMRFKERLVARLNGGSHDA